MLTNSDFIQRSAESDLIQFKHSLIQEAISKSIAPTSRRQIHQEIAQTLEKFHKEQIEHFSTMLAHHYKLAGDGEKALKYAFKAARYHARALEYRQAARRYRIALAHESTLSDKERYDTYMEFGECLHKLHQMEEAIAIYQKAETLATDKTERALAYIGLAHVYNYYVHDWTRDQENAVIYRDKAAALVDEHTDTKSIVKIFDNSIQGDGLPAPPACASTADRQGTTRQAGDNFISELLSALEIIRGRNDERAEVKLLLAIAVRLYPHDAEKSLAYQQQALSIAKKIGDDSLLGDVFAHLADIMLEHDNRQSLIFAQEALRRYEKLDDALAVAYIHKMIGRAHTLLGNTEKSIAAYEQMLKFDWLFDAWELGAECLGSLVQNYVQQGDLARARKMFFQMLNLIRKHPNKAQSTTMENAAASLCYGGVIHETTSWMRENISSTIERGCEFVADLEKRGISGTEMEELSLMHPIVAAAYLIHYSRKPLDEAVEGLELFIRNFSSMDEHVEYWAYALANINSGKLEQMFEIIVEQAASLLDVGQASCLPEAKQVTSLTVEQIINSPVAKRPDDLSKLKHAFRLCKIAPWLQATLHECRASCQFRSAESCQAGLARESKETGEYLARLGIIAEPRWTVLGPFDSANFDANFEEHLLKAVFDVERTVSSLFPWREANDNLIDGYVNCVKVMNSTEEVYGYALTVIDSPSEREVQFRIGYDDYVTVWLNGEKLLETTGGSQCIYDDVSFNATLQSGQNRLLVKIGNIEPGWGFLIRITDANGVVFDDLSYISPKVACL